MGLQISKDALDITTEVTLTMDLSRLGPRQQTSLRRMATTGLVKGESVPARVALRILQEKKLPYIHTLHYGALSWGNVPVSDEHPARRALIACMVASRLMGKEDTRQWHSGDGYLSTDEIVHNEENCSHLYGLGDLLPLGKVNFKHVIHESAMTGIVYVTISGSGKTFDRF